MQIRVRRPLFKVLCAQWRWCWIVEATQLIALLFG